ncbi:Na(+)/H(+) antiporter subunit D [Chloroflexota bacterium]
MTNFPPAVIFFVGAILLLVLPLRIRPAAFLVFPALAFWWLLSLNTGDSLSVHFLNYTLVITRVDELSLLFGYVFVLITFLGGVYGYHVKDTTEKVASLLYAGSGLGVVFAGDLFTLVIFWEIMAISSVYLIWVRRTPQSRSAGMRYLMVHLFGGSVLIAGVLIHINQTGSIDFNHMEAGISSYLILIAFCINAAVPPLHAWLADGYPEGTVTGSVFLSAFTTKTAVYALARGFAGWEILIWAGAIMALYGVIYAVLENDARRLLAYHIISQVGYMVAAVGIGTMVAINGASAHAFAHILYKGLLFMGAGALLYATGRSKLSELGGLAKAMPIAFILYMIGAFSISGVPLFSGFISKSMVIYAAGLSGLGIVVLLLNLASVGTFFSVGLKLPYFAWFSKPQIENTVKPLPLPPGMYIGMGLTAALCIAVGLYPALLYNILPYPVDYHPYTANHIAETAQILVFTGIGFYLLINKLKPKNVITLDTDWFYRRPAKLAYNVFVVSINRFFGLVEGKVLQLVKLVVKVSANPVSYLSDAMGSAGKRTIGIKDKSYPDYDPDKQRLPLEPMGLLVLIVFVGLLAWSLLQL